MAAAAAAVLESVAVPRPRPLASGPRGAVSTASAAFGGGIPSEFMGLRMARASSSAVGPARRRVARRGTAVVCEAQDTAIEVADVTKATWQSLVLESKKPVLIEFWASWCGPCRMILPTIGKLSKTYEGKLDCYKLNTDENPDIATQYGIRSIPTIMIFKNGEKKDTVIGAVPESTLVTCIEKFV